MQTFFAMGGYAAYVWPAYALFFLVLIADSVAPSLRRRRVLGELRARLARQRARSNQVQSNQTLLDAARQSADDHSSTTLPPSR
ncbi:MAG: heme exporter protein CcmD [Rhodanobacter sp.]